MKENNLKLRKFRQADGQVWANGFAPRNNAAARTWFNVIGIDHMNSGIIPYQPKYDSDYGSGYGIPYDQVPADPGTQPEPPPPVVQDPAPPPVTIPTDTAPVPVAQPPMGDPWYVADPPTQQQPVDVPISQPFSDPNIEVDYYGIGCQDLYTLIANTQAVINDASLSNEALDYYNSRLQAMHEAYKGRSCRVGQDVVDPSESVPTSSLPLPDGTQTSSTTPSADSAVPKTDAVPTSSSEPKTIKPTAGGSVATGSGGAGGGAGGGGGSQPAPAKKPDFKKDWLWWLLAASAIGVALYKGRNTEIKF